MRSHDDYHDEVATALRSIGDPAYGEAVGKDRGSQLSHLGISFPDLRRRVKQGFSFYSLQEPDVLAVWDALWQSSPYGDVLFAVIEYYAPILRKRIPPGFWQVARHWAARVDNWCHADGLGGLYSRVLEREPGQVLPQVEAWNGSEDQWLRRISLVSLIHYSGKNAAFLSPDIVLPLVANCVSDPRHHVQAAVGWVLREMGDAYPQEIHRFLQEHASRLSATALSRAIEHRPPDERLALRRLRVPPPPGTSPAP